LLDERSLTDAGFAAHERQPALTARHLGKQALQLVQKLCALE
jgi:hypothetical protein